VVQVDFHRKRAFFIFSPAGQAYQAVVSAQPIAFSAAQTINYLSRLAVVESALYHSTLVSGRADPFRVGGGL
jgi:hypothetical protein